MTAAGPARGATPRGPSIACDGKETRTLDEQSGIAPDEALQGFRWLISTPAEDLGWVRVASPDAGP